MFKRTLLRVARGLQRAAQAMRSYAAAAGGRLTSSWKSPQTTADAELHESLQTLRGRSRELVRNSAYAKRAKVVVVNNVIGPGIGMQAQVRPLFRERLDEATNAAIETAWTRWTRAEACHTGGRLHFADLERALMGEVFEAGEVFVRLHPRKFGDSRVPLGLELLEAERLADNLVMPEGVNPERYRMGVEVDEFQRPVGYWFREKHPGDVRPYAIAAIDRLFRVPAEQIIHLCVVERWPQSRGVPWLHAAMRRLNDMDGYSEAEIVAARGSAAYMAFIESAESADITLPGAGETTATDGQPEIQLEPGLVVRGEAGEKMIWNNPSRPNPNFDPFMRAMLREVAAGIGVSYESLSRDYSQSNYSSSRLALIDDRDLWRTLQLWFIRSFREPLHRRWLQAAVQARAISAIGVEEYALNIDKFEAVKWKPRGWSWVDPTKEVEAYKQAIMAGLTTRTDVIAATGNGQDIEDVDAVREQELDDAKARGLVFDTDPEVFAPPPPAPAPVAAAPEPEEEDEPDEEDAEAAAERVALRQQVNRLERQFDMQSVLRMAPTSAPAVNVAIEPGAIVVNNNPPPVPERSLAAPVDTAKEDAMDRQLLSDVVEFARTAIDRSAPTIHVAAPHVTVEAPIVQVAAPNVTVEPAQLTLEATLPPAQVRMVHPARAVVTHERDASGELVRSITTYEAAQTRSGDAEAPDRLDPEGDPSRVTATSVTEEH